MMLLLAARIRGGVETQLWGVPVCFVELYALIACANERATHRAAESGVENNRPRRPREMSAVESPAYRPFTTETTTETPTAETPSHMTAEEVSILRKFLLQTKPSTTNDYPPSIFTGATYNPRCQKGPEREQWREDIYESLRRAKIAAAELTTPPPTYEDIKLRNPDHDSDELEFLFEAALERFQDINMRMWDIVRASIVLTGPFAPSDRVHIRENFMNGDLRDSYTGGTISLITRNLLIVNSL